LRSSTPVATGAVAAGVLLLVILAWVWLGLGLTFLVLALASTLVVGPLVYFDATRGFGLILAGILALTTSFVALLEGLRMILGFSSPVCAVARNVLAEGVRMKLSVVFIVMLIVGLAALPGLLDGEQFLRYRIQSFMQFGIGGVFWLLAILTVFFGVATVAREQRDKIIWQTMTKPVAAWQYVLGKWVGVSGLAAVLMLVSSAGIFLFVNHLRSLPADGELAPYQAVGSGAVSNDRLILETRVLAARRVVNSRLPTPFDYEHPDFQTRLENEILERRRTQNERFATTEAEYLEFREELLKELIARYRSIEPGENEAFFFDGLQQAKADNRPLTLSMRIDVRGNNAPDVFYRVTVLPGWQDRVAIQRQMGAGVIQNFTISPSAIDDEGVLRIEVINGQPRFGPQGQGFIATFNQNAIGLPDEAFVVAYDVGDWRLNFMRGVFALWVKLSMLAMIAIFAGTFLSFPVASLVAFGVLFVAELSGFLGKAEDYYGYNDYEGNLQLYKFIGTSSAMLMHWLFRGYSELKPTENIVQGLMLPWLAIARQVALLGVATVVFYALAVFSMRRRELAIYSGQ
ncbi:MAG: hypothetical protein AAFU70_07240, partial [Planctomycetota bacterium]